MVKSKQIIVACVIVGIVIVAYFIFSQSETEKVKKQFEFIAEKIQKENDENPIIAAANANKIMGVFTDPFMAIVPSHKVSRKVSNEEIPPFLLGLRSQYSELSFKFYDYEIEFPTKDTANVNVTARMMAKLAAGEYIEDVNELRCKLKKIDDLWLIMEIEVVAVLEK